MKRRLIFFLILIIFSLGFVSSIWWNPLTWFEKEGIAQSPISTSSNPFELGGTNCNCGEADTCRGPYLMTDAHIPYCPNHQSELSGSYRTWTYIGWTCGYFNVDPPICKWMTPFPVLMDCDEDGSISTVGGNGDFFSAVTSCGSSATEQDCDDDSSGDPVICPTSSLSCTLETSSCAICKYKTIKFYDDSDRDGYTFGDGEDICVGDVLPNWTKTTTKVGDDCNDNVDDSSSGCPTILSSVSCTEEDIALKDCAYCQNTWYDNVYPDFDKDGSTLSGPVGKCLGTSTTSYYKSSPSPEEDCNDNNNLINPTLTEVCDDGFDNNCNTNSFIYFGMDPLSSILTPQIWDSDTFSGSDCQEQTCDTSDCSNLISDSIDGLGNIFNICTDGSGSDVCQCCSGTCKQLDRYYWDEDADGSPDKDNYEDVCFFEDLSHDNNISDPIQRVDGWYTGGPFDCDDTNPLVFPGTLYYPSPSSVSEVCWKCNMSGDKEFDASQNPESYKNCYFCNDTTQSLEFIENNKMGDDDCIWCTPSISIGPSLDPLTDPAAAGLYYNNNGKLTTDSRNVKDPLPDPMDCECMISPITGEYQNPCCYDYNTPASSRSLFTIPGEFSKERKVDCKKCSWKGSGYQYGKPSGEQAELSNANEDPQNDGGNCSYCKFDASIGGLVLVSDSTDSRFNSATLPSAPDAEKYLCKVCSSDKPDWIANDADPRVSNPPDSDIYSETACKFCIGGQLKNEKNFVLANFCGGYLYCNSSSALTEILDATKCCGGKIFDDRVQGCCPKTITGNKEIDESTGDTFTTGSGLTAQKCCAKNIITANPDFSTWRTLFWDSVTGEIPYSGPTMFVFPFIGKILYGHPQAEINKSNSTRIIVNSIDPDYCSGRGYGVKKQIFNGFTENDECSPCIPSEKQNTLVMDAISEISSMSEVVGLGYGIGAVKFLLNYKDFDHVIGLKGEPRYNRVCFEVPPSVSILPSGPSPSLVGQGYCGECDPSLNSKLPVITGIKFPFNNFGVTISKTWKRKVSGLDCNVAKLNNADISKFISASTSSTPIVEGVYWCNPEGQCEVQNHLVPGWIKFWTKKADAAFSAYQAVFGTLQLLSIVQGVGQNYVLPAVGPPIVNWVKVKAGKVLLTNSTPPICESGTTCVPDGDY